MRTIQASGSAPLKKCDVAVVLGRFQIYTKGHQPLLRTALSISDKVVVILGSAFKARDPRNPFNWEERSRMILSTLSPEDAARVTIVPVRDYYDDKRWCTVVHRAVGQLASRTSHIALVGFDKDSTSYYLRNFPEWDTVAIEAESDINATAMRNIYFESSKIDAALTVMQPYVDQSVLDYLEAWSKLPDFQFAAGQHRAVKAYREKWPAPWYMTADALVEVDDHILLGRRKGEIGHGLWALPGGFVNPFERFLEAAIRELKEETSFGLLSHMIEQALQQTVVFEHPLRSPRGRLVTVAHHFEFDNISLPDVVAADDFMEVRWVPKSELHRYEEELFEDHSVIIDRLVGLFPDEQLVS